MAGHPGYQRDPAGFWVRDQQGRLVIHEDELDGYRVRRYRPRIEGLFARIERWSKIGSPGDVHWRSMSKDNILTLYGFDADSRIADPLDAIRIFSWLICETRDDKGNAVLYRYKAEDGLGTDLGKAHERNRGQPDGAPRTANRYLKRIYYGNRTPLLDQAGHRPRWPDKRQIDTQIADAGWMFEAVFDYGDHDSAAPKPNDDQDKNAAGSPRYPWQPRPDPFSTYRPGFEVRTTRLCRRVLMFHHFPGEEGVQRDCLVRSTDFAYSGGPDPADAQNPVYAFLLSVTQSGYRRSNGGYDKRSLPPVSSNTPSPSCRTRWNEVDPPSRPGEPAGRRGRQRLPLDRPAWRRHPRHPYRAGERLVLQAQPQPPPWQAAGRRQQVKAQFGPLETVAVKPGAVIRTAPNSWTSPATASPISCNGRPRAGLYEHDEAEGWLPFRSFTSRLNRDMRARPEAHRP